MSLFRVTTFYKFVDLSDMCSRRETLCTYGHDLGLKGTVLLAPEGINGTLSGEPHKVEAFLALLRQDARLSDMPCKDSFTETLPFQKLKIRLKKEIITLGVPQIDPTQKTAQHVSPKAWDALTHQKETLLIDARNDYEYALGHFKNAINPDIRTFREFPEWVRKNKENLEGKSLALFCTGGVRCEKAGAFLLEEGFSEIYQLHGGILKYLEEISQENSSWEGDCFVFDERIALDHTLKPAGQSAVPADALPALSRAQRYK